MNLLLNGHMPHQQGVRQINFIEKKLFYTSNSHESHSTAAHFLHTSKK